MGKKLIDQEQLIFLAQQVKTDGKPWTHKEIAEELGVSRVAVTKALSKLPPALLEARDPAKFREKLPEILSGQLKSIMTLLSDPKRLRQASTAQLTTMFGILYDKLRLEEGKSTSNVLHAHLGDGAMDPETVKKLKEIITLRTQKALESINREE